MDLIEFRTNPSKGFKYILVLIEIYSRQVWADVVKDKTPDAVASALRHLLASLPKKPEVISTDAGLEWTAAVDALLADKDIIRRAKDPQDVNGIAVLERAIQNIKTRLAESLSAEPGEWSTRLRDVVAAYNSTPHATVHGEPEEVRKSPVLQDLILEDNAAKLKANQTLLESRKKQLADAGAFRRPLRGNAGAFRRGFIVCRGGAGRRGARLYRDAVWRRGEDRYQAHSGGR